MIEKFIGDAVMAVFGLPRLHEDDALRAVRAAAGMQAALEELNDELQEVYGVQLANRTGVNTGEVVAGDPTTGQRLVTGDAVNVAARLEQAAGEREVLIGALTYTLVRDNVEVEEVEPLELKGKSERVPAYRLVRVAAEPPTRRCCRSAGLVGREATSSGTLLEPSTRRDGPRRPPRRPSSVTPGSASRASPPEFLARAAETRDRALRALPSVRRRHHLLADRRGDPRPGGNRRRRRRGRGTSSKLGALSRRRGRRRR